MDSIRFPDSAIPDIWDYLQEYADTYRVGLRSVDRDALEQAKTALLETVTAGGWIYFCGNGGSAEISNHMKCDFLKSIRTDTPLRPKVQSLSAGIGLLTAIANDIDYSEIFSYQLESVGTAKDVLITVSSSGNSANIVKALKAASRLNMKSIALSGFNGGASRELASVSLHVPVSNYGIVEDAHQTLLHALAQFVRHACLRGTEVSSVNF